MMVYLQPTHLPKCPIDPIVYDQDYAFNLGTDDHHDIDAEWEEIRIRPGLTEHAVYRLLPSAGGFEYGGYLTKTRIRFLKCHATRANTLKSKVCTFHSHPTDSASADVPSIDDVFQFLYFRHIRAVTVGSTRIWVWDKTKATMTTVKKLGAWSESNMQTEARRLEKKFPYTWHQPYMKLVLQHLGLDLSEETRRDWDSLTGKRCCGISSRSKYAFFTVLLERMRDDETVEKANQHFSVRGQECTTRGRPSPASGRSFGESSEDSATLAEPRSLECA